MPSTCLFNSRLIGPGGSRGSVTGFFTGRFDFCAGADLKAGGTPEALQGIIFAAVFPLTFVSSAFVPTQSMPSWLAWFADRQPMTLVTNAVRSLTLQGSGGPTVIPAILWSIGILAVCFPLGVWLYGRRTTQ